MRRYGKWILAGVAVLLLVVVLFMRACSDDEGGTTPASRGNALPLEQHDPVVEAYVLTVDCWTPCSAFIDYEFRILRSDPLRVKYQGVADWVEYPVEWGIRIPDQMRSGETLFESSDPQNPRVRVQVEKKVFAIEVRRRP